MKGEREGGSKERYGCVAHLPKSVQPLCVCTVSLSFSARVSLSLSHTMVVTAPHTERDKRSGTGCITGIAPQSCVSQSPRVLMKLLFSPYFPPSSPDQRTNDRSRRWWSRLSPRERTQGNVIGKARRTNPPFLASTCAHKTATMDGAISPEGDEGNDDIIIMLVGKGIRTTVRRRHNL